VSCNLFEQIKSLCVAREMVKSMAVEAQAYRQALTPSIPFLYILSVGVTSVLSNGKARLDDGVMVPWTGMPTACSS
jgi:hypothetical protein